MFPVKVLITGATGQVGRALLKTRPNTVEVRALSHADLDIGDVQAVRRAVASFAPDVLINAAAYTAVDKAESEQIEAILANAKGPQHLAEAVREIAGARLIHISTDYIFDGEVIEPHRPDDPAGPISVYGQTKLVGEHVVQEILEERAVILRTAWVYAPEGKNFLLTMLRLMKERGAVDVVSDQRAPRPRHFRWRGRSGGSWNFPTSPVYCTGPMRERPPGMTSRARSRRRRRRSGC